MTSPPPGFAACPAFETWWEDWWKREVCNHPQLAPVELVYYHAICRIAWNAAFAAGRRAGLEEAASRVLAWADRIGGFEADLLAKEIRNAK